jgi:hypothetical protein
MIIHVAAAAIAAQLGTAVPSESNLTRVQYCGNGYDVDVYGHCYPNGVIPPQFQAARRYGGYGRYGAYAGPVPCGNGSDRDIRDGRCYPNGTVPPQFQAGLQGRYYRGGY